MNDQQRAEAIESIKKMVEQPVIVKQETVHVNYQIQKVESAKYLDVPDRADFIEMSLHDELAQSKG